MTAAMRMSSNRLADAENALDQIAKGLCPAQSKGGEFPQCGAGKATSLREKPHSCDRSGTKRHHRQLFETTAMSQSTFHRRFKFGVRAGSAREPYWLTSLVM